MGAISVHPCPDHTALLCGKLFWSSVTLKGIICFLQQNTAFYNERLIKKWWWFFIIEIPEWFLYFNLTMGACLLSEFILWFSPVSSLALNLNGMLFSSCVPAVTSPVFSDYVRDSSAHQRTQAGSRPETNTDLRERENNEPVSHRGPHGQVPGLQTIDNIGPRFHTWETLILTRSTVTSILLLVTGFLSCFVCLCLWLVTVCAPVLLVVCFCRTVQFSVFNPPDRRPGPCYLLTDHPVTTICLLACLSTSEGSKIPYRSALSTCQVILSLVLNFSR